MIRKRWWVVATSFMAQLVGSGAINVFAFSVLLKPIANDLGLGRGALSSPLSLSTLLIAVGYLSFGRLLERGQIRATLLPAIALFAVSVAALYRLRPSLGVVYILFGLSGFFGTGQTPLAYAKVVAQWFNKERGLGLGIMHAGIAFGGLVVTQLAKLLVSDLGGGELVWAWALPSLLLPLCRSQFLSESQIRPDWYRPRPLELSSGLELYLA